MIFDVCYAIELKSVKWSIQLKAYVWFLAAAKGVEKCKVSLLKLKMDRTSARANFMYVNYTF